jgi:NAD(P)-dependent dehydrogenase (short-subunit alcohol dehydrogenase family)
VTKTVHNDTYPAIDPTKQNLSGKAVFISGASRGIGRSIAISFAKAGASTIVLGARSSLDATEKAVQQAAQKAGRPKPLVLKIKLEVTNPASVAEAAAEVEVAVGRLDVLVNNAGVLDMKMIMDSDPETWWNVWEVNVKGPYLVARAFLPLMLKVEDSLKQVVTVARYVQCKPQLESYVVQLTSRQRRRPPHNSLSLSLPILKTGSPTLHRVHQRRVRLARRHGHCHPSWQYSDRNGDFW